MTAEQNYRLLQEIDANRKFILMAYLQNPKLANQAQAILHGNVIAMKNVVSGDRTISTDNNAEQGVTLPGLW